ncbi:hypothetical protein LO762_25250 [Actinocorallia sp. API 0066]|uniref:hypothetical protein n=1 Tax=Actinocorallia sp. API 0066 TaxID=2896846 RepID=UPI001E41860B|nr:hypothetical protein [Actinocorallia sp. API 0066]MCD0452467.1 hypothetical protein [Actinocorallia sp. API 0066]
MYGRTRRITSGGMRATRGWTAPQIHRSADFFDVAVAPRISSALHGTAKFIEPPRRRRGRGLVVGGVAIIGLCCAAAGMAVARRRGRLNELLEPEIGVSEREYVEERTTSGTYTPATGYSSSYGGGVGRGSGTGHSRGIGHD